MVNRRGSGEEKEVGGSASINIVCAEPAEDANPSVGAAVVMQLPIKQDVQTRTTLCFS